MGLRFLGTPEELGINTGDTITFTALFTAQAFLALPTPTPTPTARPTPTPTPPGPIVPRVNRLVVALPAPFYETNVPWAMSSSSLIQLRPALEHLVGIDRATGEYVPQLAEGWSVSADGMEWSNRDMHGALGGLAFFRAQPHYTVRLFNYTDVPFHGYETPELDRLYAAFLAEVDLAKRAELLGAMGQHKYNKLRRDSSLVAHRRYGGGPEHRSGGSPPIWWWTS